LATLIAACLCIRWPDASALEHRLKHGTAHGYPPFRVTDFTAEPLILSKGGRALSYVMPVALPSSFELTVEVCAAAADLGKIRIAGHPLAGAHDVEKVSESSGTSRSSESWHKVRLKRDGPELSLWIDEQVIPVGSCPQATTEWLTFEPIPERPTQFRHLVVEW
jgi:hypothetical protein